MGKKYSLLEFFDEIFVDFQAEILHSSPSIRENHRGRVIGQLAFGFSVAANQRQEQSEMEKTKKEYLITSLETNRSYMRTSLR